jgi:hypothetical protein
MGRERRRRRRGESLRQIGDVMGAMKWEQVDERR